MTSSARSGVRASTIGLGTWLPTQPTWAALTRTRLMRSLSVLFVTVLAYASALATRAVIVGPKSYP